MGGLIVHEEKNFFSRISSQPKSALLAGVVSVLLGVFTLGYVIVATARQEAICKDIVGQVLWDATSPKVFYTQAGSIFGGPMTCRFDLVEELDLAGRGVQDADLAALHEYTGLLTLVLSQNNVSTLNTDVLSTLDVLLVDQNPNAFTDTRFVWR